MIDRDRLAQTFKTLVEIDSVSREEGRFCAALREMLEGLGAETRVDDAGKKVGADTGNLIARVPGTVEAPPLLLCAHMDTVEPGRGIQAVLRDGVFTSGGDTILGADDKSAIAAMLEAVRVLREQAVPHGPLELVFTICEEVGLLGARHLDPGLLEARCGYVLDTWGVDCLATRSPAANQLSFTIHGREAHAGSAPENGINAIWLAGKAIASLEVMGRVDEETTCNIGVIEGGRATNIVPDRVRVKAEVRSHDPAKLERVTGAMVEAFTSVVDGYRARAGAGSLPRVDVEVDGAFPATNLPEDHPVVVLARRAAAALGRKIELKATGGGSDANVLQEKGIVAGVLGTGMYDVHSVRESVSLEDLVRTAELLVEIVRLHAEEGRGS